MLHSLATAAVVLMGIVSAAAQAATPAFGFTNSSSRFVINTGGGLTVTMARSTCDIVSLLYKSQELQYKAKFTHINSGLGTVSSATIAQLADAKKTIQVTCVTKGITQYYFFRPNETTIYLGTYHSNDAVLPELRFLARLDRKTVSTGVPQATLDDAPSAVEAHDVFASSNYTTRSKFYSAVQFLDDRVHGVRGTSAGVYFVLSRAAYETSSGGPFFRDINNQCTIANELTFYMNSDHTRTDDYRYGFHGPYALVFTDGPAPAPVAAAANFSFFQSLKGLTGFVKDTARGRANGTVADLNGLLADAPFVVAFANSEAQYWTKVSAAGRNFTSPFMKPGSYKLTVYKKRLAVATATATVTAGKTATLNVSVSYVERMNPIWRIGQWDGTPEGFANADKIARMHPSDVRMAAWTSRTFRVGVDATTVFPMALFRGVNDPATITFTLTAAQAASARTLEIGVTLAQGSARPSVTLNSKWTGPVPASAAVKTRGVTRGVTLGNYVVYKYTIPAKALVEGANSLAVTIASGTTDPPEKFLHAAFVFDALELS